MKPTRLTLETRDDIATLYLDAPPKNEMTGAFFEEFNEMAGDVLPRLGNRGIVVRGRGRHFSSGADVEALRRGELHRFLRNREGFSNLEGLPCPVVAAVDGACFGSGLELALACHLRVATPSALLGLPEVTFGLMPGCGGTIRLRETIGLGPALDLVLTGRFLSAREALEVGLVDAVVPRGELEDAARCLVVRLAGSVRRETP